MQRDQVILDRAIHAAQTLLSRANPTIVLVPAERLSAPGLRNLVIRCQVRGSQNGHQSVIVKCLTIDSNGDPNDPFDPRQRWLNEAAGLTFLTELATIPRMSPRIVGLDRDQYLIVIEDVHPAQRLVDLLNGGQRSVAEVALDSFARALGQLHAASFGRKAEYDAIRRRIVTTPAPSSHPWVFAIERMLPFMLRLDELLDFRAVPDLADELASVLDAMRNPGPFLAYIHGDPCPDNCLVSDSTATLIDYELGGFGHALLDVAHARMILPSCGKPAAIPPGVIGVLEDTHRHAIAQASGAAGDQDRYGRALTDACAAWLIYTLAVTLEPALGAETPDDDVMVRQQILGRLHAFVDVSTQQQRLPATSDVAQQALETLVKRWPDDPRSVNQFAVFS